MRLSEMFYSVLALEERKKASNVEAKLDTSRKIAMFCCGHSQRIVCKSAPVDLAMSACLPTRNSGEPMTYFYETWYWMTMLLFVGML
jgi:hypothetical protein